MADSWRTVAALEQTRYVRKTGTRAKREGRSLPTRRRSLVSLATGAKLGSNGTAEHLGGGAYPKWAEPRGLGNGSRGGVMLGELGNSGTARRRVSLTTTFVGEARLWMQGEVRNGGQARGGVTWGGDASW